MAQSVKYLLGKREDLSLTPTTPVKGMSRYVMVCIVCICNSSTGGESRGSRARAFRKTTEVGLWTPQELMHAHTCTHVHTHIITHAPHSYRARTINSRKYVPTSSPKRRKHSRELVAFPNLLLAAMYCNPLWKNFNSLLKAAKIPTEFYHQRLQLNPKKSRLLPGWAGQ